MQNSDTDEGGHTQPNGAVNARNRGMLLRHGQDDLDCPACGRAYEIEVAKDIQIAPDIEQEEKKSKSKSKYGWKDKKSSRGKPGRELATSPPLTRQDLQIGGMLTLLVGVSASIIGTVFWALLK